MNVWGITDTGAVRQQNQDAYRIETDGPAGPFVVVCDGMGGAKAGNIASSLAVETFSTALCGMGKPEPPELEKSLVQAVATANEAVCARAVADTDCTGMGTTLVAALLLEGTIHLVNVGDSRAYYMSGGGITKVTRDHSLVEDLVLKGEITPEEARQHPQKNLITRALGAEMTIQADCYRLDWNAGDYLLLCTDGLSNMITDQELLYETVHGGPPAQCCERLLKIALSRGAPDNVTVVLIEL
ncbi:MAG: Stp1/IreP family PP2C-type Ser/Thr phosphatase [Oscillospiraceae bacterium]